MNEFWMNSHLVHVVPVRRKASIFWAWVSSGCTTFTPLYAGRSMSISSCLVQKPRPSLSLQMVGPCITLLVCGRHQPPLALTYLTEHIMKWCSQTSSPYTDFILTGTFSEMIQKGPEVKSKNRINFSLWKGPWKRCLANNRTREITVPSLPCGAGGGRNLHSLKTQIAFIKQNTIGDWFKKLKLFSLFFKI